MKTLMILALIFGLQTASATDFSSSPFCKILNSDQLTEVYTKHMNEETQFNWWERQQIMAYITWDPAYDWGVENPTFEDIKSYFLYGDGRWDELHLTLFQDPVSGVKYTYVNSYPGDNEYGIWMEWDATVIAYVSDSDLIVGKKYCPW